MFCTTLRRRASFSLVIQKLTGKDDLGLRESQLATHDLALPINASIDASIGGIVATRQLRVLLFSHSATTVDRTAGTTERMRRFASLTGGQDLAIVFLFEATKQSNDGGQSRPSGEEGIVGYTKLQTLLADNADIPHIPVLLLAKLDGLPELLKKHMASLSRPKQQIRPTIKAFDLLQLCTANPGMPQRTAFILSDLFANLRELAMACTSVSSAPNSSSPSARAAELSSQITGTQMGTQFSDDGTVGRLKRLRDLVGEQECNDIVDFWKEEWLID